MNPNNITNVSFAASPALQAILNNGGGSNPIMPVVASKPITTESYFVQNPTGQHAVQTAVLEKTPKTDIYEPMHKRHNEDGGKKGHKAAKAAAAITTVAAIIAAVLFAPKLAEKLLQNVDTTKPFVKKGKEAFKIENIKLGLKKFAQYVEKFEKQISQDYKDGGFIRKQGERISSAFQEDGFAGRNLKKAKAAFNKDGVIGKHFAGLFGKDGASEAAKVTEKAAEVAEKAVEATV